MIVPQVQSVILSICVVSAHWKLYVGEEKADDTDTLAKHSGWSSCGKLTTHHHKVPYAGEEVNSLLSL